MNSRAKLNLPLFELSLVLVFMAMGRALWELNLISRQQKQLDTEAIALRQLKDLNRRWALLETTTANQSNVFRSFFEMEEAHKLREAYLGLADRLEKELPEMQAALVRYSSRTNDADLDLRERKYEELKESLRAHQQRLESERLVAKSQ